MLDKAEFFFARFNHAPWHSWDHSSWYGEMGIQGLFWMLAILLITMAIFAQIQASRRNLSEAVIPAGTELDARYAVGEIDRVEYLERRRNLS